MRTGVVNVVLLVVALTGCLAESEEAALDVTFELHDDKSDRFLDLRCPVHASEVVELTPAGATTHVGALTLDIRDRLSTSPRCASLQTSYFELEVRGARRGWASAALASTKDAFLYDLKIGVYRYSPAGDQLARVTELVGADLRHEVMRLVDGRYLFVVLPTRVTGFTESHIPFRFTFE